MTLIQTVQENEEGYIKIKIKDAQEARDLYAKVGYPSPRESQKLISKNMILNCPMTAEDVIRADKIYGWDIHSLKGKTPRTQPTQLVTDDVEISPSVLEKNKHATLSIEIMYVNRIPFVTTISRNIKSTTVKAIQNITKSQLVQWIKNMFPIYTQRGL